MTWTNEQFEAELRETVGNTSAVIDLYRRCLNDIWRERDEFRESALMYAAEVAELRAALPRDEEGNRQYGRLMPGGRVIPSTTPDPTHYRLNGPWRPMSRPEGADSQSEPLITTAPELAAAYGLAWPADACHCCGGRILDGRCCSWDDPAKQRPVHCVCPTGEATA